MKNIDKPRTGFTTNYLYGGVRTYVFNYQSMKRENILPTQTASLF